MKLPFRHGASNERTRGQAMVEFAIVLPIFVLFLVMAIDFGRIYFSYIQINNAAREGAAFAAGQPTDSAGILARAQREANVQSQNGQTPFALTTTCKNSGGATIPCSTATGGAGPGNMVTVAVSERFTFLTPFVNNFFSNNLTMRSSATATVLGYAASGGGTNPGACGAPVPSFTVVVVSGLTVHVDPTASTPKVAPCAISGYNWTWGDTLDGVGTAYGDDHTYLSPGTYTITLETTNQAGPATTTRQITVPAGPPPSTCVKPTAQFMFTRSGSGNKTYTYLDQSTVADPINCPITGWDWSFDDNTSSNAQNPTHVYQAGGNHSATLIVTNAGGASIPVTH